MKEWPTVDDPAIYRGYEIRPRDGGWCPWKDGAWMWHDAFNTQWSCVVAIDERLSS